MCIRDRTESSNSVQEEVEIVNELFGILELQDFIPVACHFNVLDRIYSLLIQYTEGWDLAPDSI